MGSAAARCHAPNRLALHACAGRLCEESNRSATQHKPRPKADAGLPAELVTGRRIERPDTAHR